MKTIFTYKNVTIQAETEIIDRRGKIEAQCQQCSGWNYVWVITIERSLKKRNSYICKKCASKNSRAQAQVGMRKTCLERYGVEIAAKSQIIKNKCKKQCMEKYGVESTNQLDSVKKKKEETSLKKYGVPHFSQLDSEKENNIAHGKLGMKKARETIKLKYGVDNVSQLPEVKAKQCKNNSKRKELLSKLQVETYKQACSKVIKFLEKNKVSAASDLVFNEFNLYEGTIYAMLKYSNREDLKYNGYYKSQYEKQLEDFLLSLNLEPIRNDRTILGRKELDLYLPEQKLAIEYHGLYWHCDKVLLDKDAHFFKREECLKQGIVLLQFYENEWRNKESICKSIIKSHLGLYSDRYFARKLILKSVSSEERKVFLENNHLMGNFGSGKSVGLYSPDNTLVSLMCYKKYKNGIDISRFCNLLNSTVVGGLSKIISYVTKTENPNFIQSYVDLRYHTGSGLQTIGFSLESITRGWRWTNHTETFNRLHCKANMDTRGLSEKEHAQELHLSKIYDAGQAKYVLKLK